MIFEAYLIMTTYAVSSKEDTTYLRLDFTRKRVCSIPNTTYPANYIRLTIKPVPVSQAETLPLSLELVFDTILTNETTSDRVHCPLKSCFRFKMDDPNITMEEYIMLEEEKARRRRKVYSLETVTYGRIWDEDEVHNLKSVETEFLAIVFDDTLTSGATLSCEPTVADIIKEHYVSAKTVEKLIQQYTHKKSVEDIQEIKMEHARKHQVPKETITSSDTTALAEFDQKTTLFETMTKSKSFNKSPKQRALYHALIKSVFEDEDAIDETVSEELKKRKPNDADKDEGPSVGSDRELKRRKTSKDIEPSKKAESTKTSKGTSKSQPKSTSKFTQVEETVFEAEDTQGPQNLREDTGDRYPFDLSKPLPLVMSGYHQIFSVDYFFNNDLAYLQGGSTGRTYTTSLTKTKAAKYDLPGIEYMVPNLWSLVKVAYANHALLGTSHWAFKRQSFYKYASNRESKHDVYFTKRIFAVTNIKVKEWYAYGHLEEIEVQRSDKQLYNFMKGDFPRLYLHDIKDMLILLVQNRLFNLKGDVIVYLAATLRMFTRRIVIKKRAKDLQLGVESYQKSSTSLDQ
nr:hypothetical protein [Tanacetum cinerariifolium]